MLHNVLLSTVQAVNYNKPSASPCHLLVHSDTTGTPKLHVMFPFRRWRHRLARSPQVVEVEDEFIRLHIQNNYTICTIGVIIQK